MSETWWASVIRCWRAVEQWVEETVRFPSASMCPESNRGPTDCYLEGLSASQELHTGVRRLFIAEERTFAGVTFRARSVVEFHPNGRVASGSSAKGRSQQVAGLRFAGDTALTFWPNGKLMSGVLEGEQLIGDLWFAGKTPDMFIGPMTVFYENGNVMQGVSAKNQTIEQIEFKKDAPIVCSITGRPTQDPPRFLSVPYGKPPAWGS